jgi:hypothetical protein
MGHISCQRPYNCSQEHVCQSNNERKAESSCAAVKITAESGPCFISCIKLQLSTEDSFLLHMNVGGGLGTNKFKSHSIVNSGQM